MMQLWMEDAKMFKQESNMAKEERRRLEKIHGKVHDRAKVARYYDHALAFAISRALLLANKENKVILIALRSTSFLN